MTTWPCSMSCPPADAGGRATWTWPSGDSVSRRKILLRSQHYLLTPQVVRSTDLALSAPASLAAMHGLHCLKLPFEVAPLEIRMYWHKRVESDPALSWLRSQVQAVGARVTAAQQSGG